MLKLKKYFLLGFLLIGCNQTSQINTEKITIGIVSYGNEIGSLDEYEPLKKYLAQTTKSIIELEPAYNELQASEQLRRNKWSIAFVPPGLAAIAIDRYTYLPLFSLEGVSSLERSFIVVKDDNNITTLKDLANKKVALGEPGSAAGYYLPLYDLYGLTLSEVIFAPTPQQVLQLVSNDEVVAGALSEKEFQAYKNQFDTKFRVLKKSRWIPSGLVIVNGDLDSSLQEKLQDAMIQAPTNIIGDAGYVVETKMPNYQEFIKLINKVKPLEEQVKKTPAVLTIETQD